MIESSLPAAGSALVDIRHLPWIRPLAADYAHAFSALAPFYAGDPRDGAAWRASIARTQAFSRDRRALVDLLRAQQDRRRAPQAARAATERLLDPRTVAVVTGQQAGVVGGPLFTLLKALTTIRLARTVEQEYGTPAVAVFWIDAEDHDWDEVASTTILDADFRTATLRLPSPPRANEVPVASIHLDASIGQLLATLQAALPRTEFTDDLIARLAAAYRPGVTMADAFGQWVEDVLGSLGLVLYDCADVAAKPLAARVFTHELAHPGKTWEMAAEAGAALERLGYHAQVAAHPHGVALFYLGDGRLPIRLDGQGFAVGDTTFAADRLLREAEREPARFSPNVLLRPLVQDTVFPTVAYVGGPSELAYLGQLKPVYAHFGIPMPLVVPRATATLLDAGAARFLSRYHLGIDAFQAQDEAELNRLLETLLPPQVEGSLQDAQKAIEERMGAVIAALPALDPTLEGAARSTLGRMEHDLRTLHTKVIHAAKKRDDTLRRQFVRARALVFPDGHPQERTLGFVWFLNRYGPALVDILDRELPPEVGLHALLTP